MSKPNDTDSAQATWQPSATREGWGTISIPIRPEYRPVVEKAMRLAGALLGPGTPDWRKLEFIALTYLCAHGRPRRRR